MSDFVFPIELPGCDVKIVRAPKFSTNVQKVGGRDVGYEWYNGHVLDPVAGDYDSGGYGPRNRYVVRLNVMRQGDLTEVDELLETLWTHYGQYDSFLLRDPYDNQWKRVRLEEDQLGIERIVMGLWKSQEIRLYETRDLEGIDGAPADGGGADPFTYAAEGWYGWENSTPNSTFTCTYQLAYAPANSRIIIAIATFLPPGSTYSDPPMLEGATLNSLLAFLQTPYSVGTNYVQFGLWEYIVGSTPLYPAFSAGLTLGSSGTARCAINPIAISGSQSGVGAVANIGFSQSASPLEVALTPANTGSIVLVAGLDWFNNSHYFNAPYNVTPIGTSGSMALGRMPGLTRANQTVTVGWANQAGYNLGASSTIVLAAEIY
jgi:hypothetical protein